jgi:type III restriction enzyme
MLTYAEIADTASDLIYAAIAREAEARGEPIVKAMLDPYNPAGSTDHVSFITSSDKLWATDAAKSHVNYVVYDSDWEAEFARVVEAHPATISYVKNQALGFEVPYRDGATPRRYLPDFIVKLDDGHGPDDPLHLVVEIKGYRGINAQLKAEVMSAFWVPGVNNLKFHGRWAFAELRDGYSMQEQYTRAVERLTQPRQAAE